MYLSRDCRLINFSQKQRFDQSSYFLINHKITARFNLKLDFITLLFSQNDTDIHKIITAKFSLRIYILLSDLSEN